MADVYLAGVSSRRLDKLVKTLGIEGTSKSQVSRMAAELDEMVEAFRTRPLEGGRSAYIATDVPPHKVRGRELGRHDRHHGRHRA